MLFRSLDQELQRYVDEVPVEPSASESERQRDGRDFVHDSGGQRRRRAQHPFGQRCDVANVGALAQLAQAVFHGHVATYHTTRIFPHALAFCSGLGDAYSQVQQPEGGDPMSSEISGVSAGCERHPNDGVQSS